MSDWLRLLAFAKGHFGSALALATLVGREGSSYRQPGARMLVNDRGVYVGSLSGGCLEDDLARFAQSVLTDGRSRLRTIDTRPHYGCPGRLEIFIERLPASFFQDLALRIGARAPCRLRTRFKSSAGPLGTTLETAAEDDPPAYLDKGDFIGSAGKTCFTEDIGRQPRLVVVSGSDDVEPLRRFAELLGWQFLRIVPLGEAARREVVEGDFVCPAEDLPVRFPPDERTAVLIMTHNLARDTHYLRHALPAPYAYVGLLGSRRRRDTILAELGEAGLLADESITDRLYSPVGLDLGATDPASIALSIVAEIQSLWSGRSAVHLRQRRAPIHDTARVALARD